MVENNFALANGTILNGKYIIDSVLRVADSYIEYSAVDLIIKEEIIIRELYSTDSCARSIGTSDDISIIKENIFEKQMEKFKQSAEIMARANDNLYAKNFFYENNTGYIVLAEITYQPKSTKKKHFKIMIFVGITISIVLITFITLSLLISINNKKIKKDNLVDDIGKDHIDTNSEDNSLNETDADNMAEPKKIEENLVDISLEEYLEKYEKSGGLYIRDYLYDDFDGNGTHEIFMTKSASENWRAQIDEIEKLMAENNYEQINYDLYNALMGETYSIWYADAEGEKKLDEFIDDEEWNRALYKGLDIIQFGAEKQVRLQAGHWYGEWNGWVTDYPTQILYDVNDNGAYEIQRFEEAMIEIEEGVPYLKVSVDDSMFPRPRTGFPSWLTYPLLFLDGKYTELASCEVDKRILNRIDDWSNVNKKIIDTLHNEGYENGVYGSLATEVDLYNINIENVLYSDSGKLYVNYTADGYDNYNGGVLEGVYALSFEAEMDIKGNKVSNIHVMEGNRLASYFGEDNAIVSAVTPLYEGLGISEADIDELQESVMLTVYTADNVSLHGDYAELKGVIQETGEDRTYIIDDDTKIIADTQYFSKYEDGMSGYDWIKKLSSGLNDSNWMDICGVYELQVTGNNVDVISGLYWWD